MNTNNETLKHRERVIRSRVGKYIFIHVVIFLIMLIKLAKESSDNGKFSTAEELFYIWEDGWSIVFSTYFARSIPRGRIWLQYHRDANTFIGYTSLIFASISYNKQVFDHVKLFGSNVWEDYPFGMFWYEIFTLNYVIRYLNMITYLELIKVRLLLLEEIENREQD